MLSSLPKVSLLMALAGVVMFGADTAGKFTIYMGGKPVASETYSITRTDSKVELSGSGRADLGVIKVSIEKFVVTSDAQFQPLSAEVKAQMGQIKMEDSITFAEGKAKNQINTGQGPTTKEDDVHPGALVVNSNLPLFAWTPLAYRVKLDSSDPQTFNAYIVGQTEVPVTVVSKGKETVEFAASSAQLNRFGMTFPPGATAPPINVDVWMDDARKIIKIAVPAQNVEAYQDGFDPKPKPPAPAPAAEPKTEKP